MNVEKQGYDVEWFNPINGEHFKVKQKEKAESVTFSPPDTTHDWVLHISREGHKQGMLRSWKFESRPFLLQEPESGVSPVTRMLYVYADGSVTSGAADQRQGTYRDFERVPQPP